MAGIAPLSSEDLKKRLEMDHLVPERTEDLKAAIQKDVEAPPDKARDDPKGHERYSFELDWTDGRGKRWLGEFTNKILSLRERQLVGVMRARFAGGMPVSSVDEMTHEINLMLAHLAFSLVEKPDWAEELRNIQNVQLLQEIYAEAASHEATFLGWGAAEG